MHTLYFAYAVYGFTFTFIGLSAQYEMVNAYHYTAADLAISWSMVSMPWGFKPLYGYISDRVGRRLCVAVGAFFGGICLAYLPLLGDKLVFGLSAASFFICFADVASDSMVVSITKQRGRQVQSNCWTARSFGSMIATGLSGAAYELLHYENVMHLSSAGPFLLCLVIWGIEEPKREVSSLRDAVGSLYKMRFLLLTAVMLETMPEIDTAFFSVLQKGLTPVEMSITSVCGAFASCVVSFLYQYTGGFRRCLYASVALNMICALLAFAIYMGAPMLGFEIVRSVLGSVASMLFLLPVVIEAAKMSTHGSEGVSYALFVSCMNLSGVLGEYCEGLVVRAVGDMGLYLVLCVVVMWLPLLVI
jgi:hypothetical protein